VMRFEVSLPTGKLLDKTITKLLAPGLHGSFCLLPRHVDCVAIIRPGILLYVADGEEFFLAVDDGVLCKKGSQITLVTLRAVEGSSLESLASELAVILNHQDQQERQTRAALASLESRITRGLTSLESIHG